MPKRLDANGRHINANERQWYSLRRQDSGSEQVRDALSLHKSNTATVPKWDAVKPANVQQSGAATTHESDTASVQQSDAKNNQESGTENTQETGAEDKSKSNEERNRSIRDFLCVVCHCLPNLIEMIQSTIAGEGEELNIGDIVSNAVDLTESTIEVVEAVVEVAEEKGNNQDSGAEDSKESGAETGSAAGKLACALCSCFSSLSDVIESAAAGEEIDIGEIVNNAVDLAESVVDVAEAGAELAAAKDAN
ncbi:uncharacterized protein LOC121401607 [Xenopus laevis]|uniref:Uncharacterized protein LOC121401607 n=1 Tax=Xenopus laevis TaxID=8355 RepID=A0A8J1MNQ8_XENLA|nr:uncharacterized protein LOC121401607 [Xenopus laevis]